MISIYERVGRLVDAQGSLIGVAHVFSEAGLWSGEIDLSGAAPSIASLFTRFEELVNGQMLSLVDEIEKDISRLGARFLWDEGGVLPVSDLQIYPSQRQVSFRTTDGRGLDGKMG